MQYRYLRAALLAGLIATTASAESAGIAHESAVSQIEPSPSRHDDAAAITVSTSQNLATMDDENRALMSLNEFLRKVLLSDALITSIGLRGKSAELNRLAETDVTPSQYYKQLAVHPRSNNLLADTRWQEWAFFVSKRSKLNGMDPHKSIVDAMMAEMSTKELNKMFNMAAKDPVTKLLATELRHHLWKATGFIPSAFARQKFDLTAKNFFERSQFKVWTKYLNYLYPSYKVSPITLEVEILREIYGDAALVKMLISPDNANNVKAKAYWNVLFRHWLDERKSPSDIVILLAGVEVPLTFLHYQSNKQILNTWATYRSKYEARYPDNEQTMIGWLTTAIGPTRAAMIMQSAAGDKDINTRHLAMWGQRTQFRIWVENDKTPKDVLKLLKEDVTARSWLAYQPALDAVKWTKEKYIVFRQKYFEHLARIRSS